MAVVAAGELEDAVAAREAAREPDRAHRRFRARGDEADELDRRERIGELLRELDLPLGRRAERRAVARGADDGLHGLRIGVAEDQRPPRHDPVEVAPALLVLDVRAFAAAHEQWLVE